MFWFWMFLLHPCYPRGKIQVWFSLRKRNTRRVFSWYVLGGVTGALVGKWSQLQDTHCKSKYFWWQGMSHSLWCLWVNVALEILHKSCCIKVGLPSLGPCWLRSISLGGFGYVFYSLICPPACSWSGMCKLLFSCESTTWVSCFTARPLSLTSWRGLSISPGEPWPLHNTTGPKRQEIGLGPSVCPLIAMTFQLGGACGHQLSLRELPAWFLLPVGSFVTINCDGTTDGLTWWSCWMALGANHVQGEASWDGIIES